MSGKPGDEFEVFPSFLPQYVPVKGDRVLGVVVRTGRVHRVDIGGALPAALPELAFQGATKRNKPSLQVSVEGSFSLPLIFWSSWDEHE